MNEAKPKRSKAYRFYVGHSVFASGKLIRSSSLNTTAHPCSTVHLCVDFERAVEINCAVREKTLQQLPIK